MSDLSNPNAYSGIVKGLGGESSVDFPTDITNPQNGQMLQYDATTEKWVNVDNEPCVVDILVSEELITATNEDCNNYKYDNQGNLIQEGNLYGVRSIGISINDLERNKIFRYNYINEEHSSFAFEYILCIEYFYEDDFYNGTLSVLSGDPFTFTVANKNLEIKNFSPLPPISPDT